MTRLFKVVPAFIPSAVVSMVMFAAHPTAAEENLKTGNWQTICDPQGCRLAQSLVASQTERLLLMARIFNGASPTLVLTVPLGSFLKAGVQMSIDNGAPRALDYEICNEVGCHAAIPIDDRLLRDFKRGLKADVTFADGTQELVTLSLSLVGFTKGMEVLGRKPSK